MGAQAGPAVTCWPSQGPCQCPEKHTSLDCYARYVDLEYEGSMSSLMTYEEWSAEVPDTEPSLDGFTYCGYRFETVSTGVRLTNLDTGGSTVLDPESWRVVEEQSGGCGVLPPEVAHTFMLCWPNPSLHSHVRGCRTCRMELDRGGSPLVAYSIFA